jgi:Ser/Thr protein kinase RdoA (MazF antagonist)
LSPAEAEVAAGLLSSAWGEPAGTLAAEPVRDRAHVFRLRRDDGRSAVLKRREAGQHGDFGSELATLEFLNAMPEPVAPRLLGADAEAGILVMEDLGPGPSLADALLTGEFDQAQAGLIAYARALGRLHAWSASRGAELAALRARYAPGAALEPAWMGAIERGREAFLGVAAGLGLATDGVGDEISGLGALMSGSGSVGSGSGGSRSVGSGSVGSGLGGSGLGGSGYLGLVHGDACPDNVRLTGGDCLIFDFETSGWGPVVLDVAYLLAPFPSCWCFGAVPSDVAVPALDAYRVQVTAGTNDLGPDWPAAMAAAVAGWIVARGSVMASVLDEDRGPWGTTGMRPRLLAWMRSFTGAASQARVLPRLRALTGQLAGELSSRWADPPVPDYPALARPGALLVEIPGWWRPEG